MKPFFLTCTERRRLPAPYCERRVWNRRSPTMCLLLMWSWLAIGAHAQEWTRFRGPNGTGISHARTIPSRWSETDLNWKVPLPGTGHCSPVLWGATAFVTASDEASAQFTVLGLDVSSGEIRWRREFPFASHPKHSNNTFASSTPAADAANLYVLRTEKGRAFLLALTHSGETAWERDIGPFTAEHGSGTSPIVHDGMVILTNDGDQESSLLALDAASGATRWKTPRKPSVASYSTPCLLEGPQPALIFNSQSHGISAVSPATGEVLWEYPAFDKRAVSSPVIAEGLIIGSCGTGGGGSALVAVRPGDSSRNRAPEMAYQIRRSIPYVPTSIAAGGALYLWNDGGIVTCLDAPTGGVKWQERAGGNFFSSPVWVDGRLFCVSTTGDVVVLAATPERFEVLARNPLNEVTHSTPAVAGGRMYIRTSKSLVSIGGGSPSAGN